MAGKEKKKRQRTLRSSIPLTGPYEDLRKRTFPGMASWGGSGPPLATCRECMNWEEAIYYADGMLRAAHCLLAKAALGPNTPKVPHYASACNKFISNPAPPLPYIEPKGSKPG